MRWEGGKEGGWEGGRIWMSDESLVKTIINRSKEEVLIWGGKLNDGVYGPL